MTEQDDRYSLFAAADRGIFALTEKDGGWVAELLLGAERVRSLAIDSTGSSLYVGSQGGGLRKSADRGRTWRDLDLPQKDVFAVAISPVDGAVYAGTEPSMLFVSHDDAESWRELESLKQIPSAPTWSFPPRPWTSHVSSIAPDPHNAKLLLVGIELGGLMRSEDAGETWADHAQGAQRDVHALRWHPRVSGRAYEAGGGGAAWSRDGGRTWQPVDEGRDRHYTWAIAIDPVDPDLWFVSASTSARRAHARESAEAHIYRWSGAGPWKQMRGSLPEPIDSMPYALLNTGALLLAGLADGRIYRSDDRGESWRSVEVSGPSLKGLRAFAGPVRLS